MNDRDRSEVIKKLKTSKNAGNFCKSLNFKRGLSGASMEIALDDVRS